MTEGGRMGLRELLGAFRRRLVLFVAIAGAVFIVSIAASLLLTPKYTAATSIKIDMNARTPVVEAAEAPRSAAAEQSAIDTEAAVMRSRGVAELVVDRLKLTQDPEFSGSGGKGLLPGGGRPRGNPRDTVVQNVMDNMSVEREGTTYIIDMTFTSENPRKAAAIANAFGDAYLDTSLDMKLKGVQQASHWLNDRINKLGQEVQSADSAVANYRSSTGIVTGLGSGASVTDQQIGTVTSALAMAESAAADAQSKASEARSQMNSGAGIESVAGVLASPVIAELRRQRTAVLSEQANASTKYGPKHPEVQRITQQLNGLDQQIRDEASRIVAGLNSEARAAQARAGTMRAQLNQLQGHQAVNSRAEVEATGLERDAEAKRTMYNQLAVTAQQVNQQQNLRQIEQKILSRAEPPTSASFPNKMLFAALGVILGGVLGAAGVLVAEAMESTILSVNDIEALGLHHLASLPELTSTQLHAGKSSIQPWDYVVERPMSIYSEALRSVRSALSQGGSRASPKVVVITSSVPEEGKSVAAVSLARVMALSGDRVLLMDCDLRKNALQGLLKKKADSGLVELLAGKARLADVLVKDPATGLDILPLSESLFTPKDLFGGDGMQTLIDSLRPDYDSIIIDAPPMLAVTDARTLATLADAILLSIRWRSTPREVIDAALIKLDSEAEKIVGALLTRVDPNLRANNVGYYHHYAKGYYTDS